ncbi:RSP_2648 family PIN domain-containing protein [Tropicibacter sp. Alg240-R139]|uniref:RSP_2648 family PIN domain-containing protein n=1 Tax=Tropicibacter sp. Alg240-R139 TaxID=2305991 RepID=UPI0013DEC732|nr:PIN domain-containing protein [Tropicibacter sp. Alg240-R139]
MRAVLDTCVIFPTVMREMLLGAARAEFYTPLWSARILEEWARASIKLGPTGEAQARSEIALIRANWPGAEVAPAPGIEQRLWLPDAADVHVLAAAIAGSADTIVTVNRRDFPRHLLAEEDLDRIDPDTMLVQFWQDQPAQIASVAAKVLDEANRLSGGTWEMRPLLKKARLPRLAKALTN